jgi:hypothetical protein
MIAALFWLAVLAVLVLWAAELRAKIVADELGDTVSRHVWELPERCYLCSARLATEGHYVAWSDGASRCVCRSCASLGAVDAAA